MSLLDQVKNTTHSIYKSTAEYLTSDKSLKKSAFNEKGVLTPDEFIKAGCQLVYKCPTWQWEGGDNKKKKKYFPSNQQYLITRSVPCLKRVSSLKMDNKTIENIVENGEWLEFDNNKNNNNNNDNNKNKNNKDDDLQDIEDIDDINEVYDDENKNNDDNNDKISNDNDIVNNDKNKEDDNNNEKNDNNDNNNTNNDKNEEDEDEFSDFEEIPDIETFNDDDNVVTNEDKIKDIKKNKKNDESKNNNDNINDTIMKTRTYDISITYDKYYRVPRVWLRGYDENKNPLTSSQIFEDISADHAHKTVTVEQHPHMSAICASIHPCRHADVMKIFMERMEQNGSKFTVDQYMFLFLKFMNAVIPTIEYDFTIQASTN